MPTKLYILHAFQDRDLAKSLKDHLGGYVRAGEVVVESVMDLVAGDDRTEQLRKRALDADGLVLLMSAHLLADQELNGFLDPGFRAKGRKIVVLGRPVDIGALQLDGFHVLPASMDHVTTAENTNEALLEVTSELAGFFGWKRKPREERKTWIWILVGAGVLGLSIAVLLLFILPEKCDCEGRKSEPPTIYIAEFDEAEESGFENILVSRLKAKNIDVKIVEIDEFIRHSQADDPAVFERIGRDHCICKGMLLWGYYYPAENAFNCNIKYYGMSAESAGDLVIDEAVLNEDISVDRASAGWFADYVAGQLISKQGDYEQAIVHYMSGDRPKLGGQFLSRFQIATILYKQGRYEQAARIFEVLSTEKSGRTPTKLKELAGKNFEIIRSMLPNPPPKDPKETGAGKLNPKPDVPHEEEPENTNDVTDKPEDEVETGSDQTREESNNSQEDEGKDNSVAIIPYISPIMKDVMEWPVSVNGGASFQPERVGNLHIKQATINKSNQLELTYKCSKYTTFRVELLGKNFKKGSVWQRDHKTLSPKKAKDFVTLPTKCKLTYIDAVTVHIYELDKKKGVHKKLYSRTLKREK